MNNGGLDRVASPCFQVSYDGDTKFLPPCVIFSGRRDGSQCVITTDNDLFSLCKCQIQGGSFHICRCRMTLVVQLLLLWSEGGIHVSVCLCCKTQTEVERTQGMYFCICKQALDAYITFSNVQNIQLIIMSNQKKQHILKFKIQEPLNIWLLYFKIWLIWQLFKCQNSCSSNVNVYFFSISNPVLNTKSHELLLLGIKPVSFIL